MRDVIHTDKAPGAIGPYNQAILANGTLYVSGQIPINPKTAEIISSSITDETHRVMQNLEAILTQAEMSWENVVKCTIFTTDISKFSELNEVYGSYFNSGREPARECVEVSKLPKNVSVEISLIAVK